MISTVGGEKWKQLRSKLSPVFTSGRLRHMVPKLNRVGVDMKEYFEGLAERGKSDINWYSTLPLHSTKLTK